MGKMWEDWEIDFLRLVYPDPWFTSEEIAKILSRTKDSITLRAQKIYVKYKFNKYFKKSVCDILKMRQMWDYKKNNECPNLVSYQSHKLYYWKCVKNNNHQWKAPPNRIYTNLNNESIGCAYCAGQQVYDKNCLAYQYPNISKHWDYKKNKDTPYDVTGSSNKKRWFKCEKNLHPTYLQIIQTKSYGGKCPFCSSHKLCLENSLITKYPEIASEWYIIKNYPITPRDIFPNSHKKFWWQCKNCNHKWKTTSNHRTNGKNGCPKCNESKGEKEITKYLDKNKIIYKSQYRIKKCKHKKPLPFDFAIFNSQNKLIGLIEYNGIQHYIIGQQFGRKNPNKKFKSIQKHDTIKVNYCKNNNTPLLIIPYTEFDNIKNLVNQFYEQIQQRTIENSK